MTCRDEELLLCSSTAEDGRNWVEAINSAVSQLEANFRTLRKESSSRRPMRKRQLRQNESNSLMRKFQAKRVAAAHDFDVDFLRSPHSTSLSSPLPPATPIETPQPLAVCKSPKSPCPLKLPKWPSPCPGSTPSFVCSPRKLLLGSLKPTASPVKEVTIAWSHLITFLIVFPYFLFRLYQSSSHRQSKRMLAMWNEKWVLHSGPNA